MVIDKRMNRTRTIIYDPLSKQLSTSPESEKSPLAQNDSQTSFYYSTSLISSSQKNSFETTNNNNTTNDCDLVLAEDSISQDEDDNDDEDDKTNLTLPCLENYRFPKISILVLVYLFLSKLSFISIQTLFSIYVLNHLKYSKTVSTIFYHTMSATSSLCTIFAASLADNYIGRLRTMVIFGVICALGNMIIPICVALDNIVEPLIFGILLLAIGEGGLRACLSAFGADQLSKSWYNEHTNKRQYFDGKQEKIENYFSLVYFVVNIAGLCGNFIFPIIKSKVYCHSDYFGIKEATSEYRVEECYPLTLLITFLAYSLGFIVFLAGFKFYIQREYRHHVMKLFASCIITALRNRKSPGGMVYKREKMSFLDYARIKGEYSVEFIQELRKAMRVAFVFLPFPIFWSLYEQEASKWLFQANQMDGKISQDYSWTIQPEQMLAINLMCCVIAIPFKNVLLNPILMKLNILNRSTSKMVFGYLLAALSFLIAGSLQYYIDSSLTQDLPVSSNAQLYCMTLSNSKDFFVSLETNENIYKINDTQPAVLDFKSTLVRRTQVTISNHSNMTDLTSLIVDLEINHRTYLLIDQDLETETFLVKSSDVLKSFPIVRVIKSRFYNIMNNDVIKLINKQTRQVHELNISSEYANPYSQVEPGIYNFQMDNSQLIDSYPLDRGTISLLDMRNGTNNRLHEIFRGKTVTIWAQLPQIIVLTFAELFLCISALDFAYFEAPESMRTIMQALNYTTMFLGNLLVILFSLIYKRFECLTKFGYDYFIESAIALFGTFALKVIIDWYNRQAIIIQLSEAKLTSDDSSTKNISYDGEQIRKISSYISTGSQFSTTSRKSIVNWSSSLISNEISQNSMTSLKFGLM